MNESTPQKPEMNGETYAPIDHEIMYLGHLSKTEKAMLVVMIKKAERGLEPLPDDPTVRAAVNALLLEENGLSTDDSFSEDNKTDASDSTADTGTDTPEASKAKLLEAVSEEKFNLAVQAAKELDPNLKLPNNAREWVVAGLELLSPERVAEICTVMEKPTLIIIPANSFDKKVKQMNQNKHYEGQDNTFVALGDNEPYRQVAKIVNVRVCIVDGVVHPKQQKDAPITLGARRKYEQVRFAKKNMKLAGPHAMATLLQQTLIESEKTGDNSKIIDNWEDGSGTSTILNPEELADSTFVAYADFRSRERQVDFFSRDPDFESDLIRGRALVQVLEF